MNIKLFFRLSLILSFVLIASFRSQQKFIPTIKKYSFGKAIYVGTKKLPLQESNYQKLKKKFSNYAFININGAFYSEDVIYNSKELSKIFFAHEINKIWLINPKIIADEGYSSKVLSISGIEMQKVSFPLRIASLKSTTIFIDKVNFEKELVFQKFQVSDITLIDNSKFKHGATFIYCDFCLDTEKVQIIQPEFNIRNSNFDKDLMFMNCKLPKTYITNSNFNDGTFFFNVKFLDEVKTINSTINGNFSFHRSNFKSRFELRDIKILGRTNFADVNFEEDISFIRVDFFKTLSFFNTKLNNGIDLRRCNFDSLKSIYLEGMEYPTGKLFIDWDQIKYRDKPIIALDTSSNFHADNFKRLENIYQNLINNYQVQGNKLSVDEVKYELEVRRQEYFGKPIHWVYGQILGYGYKPVRFIIMVVIIIFIFAFILYRHEYKTVFYILNPENKKQYSRIELSKKNFLRRGLLAKHNTGEKYSIPYLAIFWRSIFMSSSLLLGLRFKKEWIRDQEKTFLTIASIEWVLGIGLYIFFALCVKTFRFEFLKGIFGL